MLSLSWQNLNDDRRGRVKGSILRAGRWWLRLRGSGDYFNRPQLNFEWSLGGSYKWVGAEVAMFTGDSHRSITLSLGVWFACFYLTLERFLPEWCGYPRHMSEHRTGVSVYNDGSCDGFSISANFHHAGGNCFDCKGWRGPHWYWWPLNTLLGRPAYMSIEIESVDSFVQMPEGSYPVQVKLTEDRWTRSRWPWPLIVHRAHIESITGIPIPGKGENGWDCKDDATFSLTCPAKSVEDAIATLRESAMRTREKRASRNWQPAGTL